ncbi:unnamed protein product [Thlaspi arvense]|uniref:Pentatricopeptide repeat-containing protein n=1 Tax=Thlaspi arvense TaxID=13288 RepID=A0AAU9RQQ0_THLAR|nr:unnamed protein product [Thlaspi arvense]
MMGELRTKGLDKMLSPTELPHKLPLWSDASGLLSDMMEKKINPNVLTDAFLKESKLLEAEKLYQEMIERSIDP